MKKNNRDYFFKIRVNEEEKNLIDGKFILSGFQSKSQFIRTMIFEGAVIKTDGTFQDISRNIARISANLNQIAVRVNSTGSIYADDVQEIRKELNEIWRQFRVYQSEVNRLTE